jgi:hypothetical protein
MQGDDIEEIFDMTGEDIALDLKDRSRLDMLEQYRSSLVAGARNIPDKEDDDLTV